jgi:CBS domain-containing protein
MTLTSASPLVALRAVVIDTETTGLDSRTARILQIAAVGIENGLLVSPALLDSLVNCEIPIPESSTAIHGITYENIRTAPLFRDLVSDLDHLLKGALLIGHSIAYDIAVLSREYEIAGAKWQTPRFLDVRMLGRVVVPTLADHSLDRLCEWAGVVIGGRHSAIGDARATAELFLKLVPLLRAKGIRTLAEAEAACRRLSALEAGPTGFPLDPSPPRDEASAIPFAQLDSFAYRHRVADVMSAPAVFADPQQSLSDVLRELIDRRISSVLVQRTDGDLAIATERDILRAIHARGAAALALPVAEIATGPLQTVAADEHLYRAIGRVSRLGFRHLGVCDSSGDVVGMVTTRNLLKHRSSTALMIGDEIEAASGAPALASAWGKLPTLAKALRDDGVDVHTIAGVISAEIVALTRRAARLAEMQLRDEGAHAPATYAVLVLGSSGRGESMLSADQDNAIVYDGEDDGGEAATYFTGLGRRMNDILHTAGLQRCPGGVMAGNRAWCMSLSEWRATIDGWISRHSPQDLLNVDIFFDAVWAYGDRRLAAEIWSHAYAIAHRAVAFQKLLTELARNKAPALNILGSFRVDEKGRIDVKKAGLMPTFTCARVLSIRHDVRERSTVRRLSALPEKGIGSPEIIATITGAHGTLMSLVLAQQLRDIEAGVPPSAKVAPGQLSKSERKSLKAALGAVDEIIGLVSEGRL